MVFWKSDRKKGNNSPRELTNNRCIYVVNKGSLVPCQIYTQYKKSIVPLYDSVQNVVEGLHSLEVSDDTRGLSVLF